MSGSGEAHLIARAQADSQAFAPLYDRYFERIYAFILLQTHNQQITEDVVANVFEKALRHIGRYQWQGVSFGAWLYRIAHNELVSYQRRQKLLSPLTTLVDTLRSDGRSPEQAVEQEFELKRLQQALTMIPANDREIIILRFLQGLTGEEVAHVLGCSRQAVYLRLHRALKKLRQQLLTLEGKGTVEPYVAYE